MAFDKRLDPKDDVHHNYVKLAMEMRQYYERELMPIWEKTMDWWDLFLAIQEDLRDPIDEQWRSNVFVPLPFTATRAKVTSATDMIANTEPVWQAEVTREGNHRWAEQAKQGELTLDYVQRMNVLRKFLGKILTSRSVQGTVFFKVVWTRRSSVVQLYPDSGAMDDFTLAIQTAEQRGIVGAPDWVRQPREFEAWRTKVNKAAQHPGSPVTGIFIPPAPISGDYESVEYEGPTFQSIPIYRVMLDPYVDEIKDQVFLIHRMIKPLSFVERLSDDKQPMPGGKPYIRSNVEFAQAGWDGEVMTTYESQLAGKLGLSETRKDNPYFRQSVILDEIWSPMEPFKYTVVMNEKAIINKQPFNRPLLTTSPNIFALRNIMVPGFFYGLSDYQEPETLFREINQFRRIRRDGATLNALPVFVKQAGVNLTEQFKKLKPGLVLTLPTKDAITSLINHSLPPEAYREPAEMKDDIYDATEVPPYMKGQQATLNRVTGTEFQGRANATTLKNKIDVCFIEDETMMLPTTILSFFAQIQGDLKKEVGDMTIDLPKNKLVQLLNIRYRFRGASKHLQEDMQIQQLTQALAQFQDVLSATERRAALQILLEILDIRGWSKILTVQGGGEIMTAEQTAGQATNAQNVQAADQASAAGVQTPGPTAVPAPAEAPAQGGGQ
jgi:hypothetical protein